MSETNQELRRIEEFLREWDPIGVGADAAEEAGPSDEYDSYAPSLHRLLRQGCDAREMEEHLMEIEAKSMGLTPSADKTRVVAQRIVAWWTGRGASKT